MRLPRDATVASEKIVNYLLVRQNRSDKSEYLARGGFSLANADAWIASLKEIRDGNNEAQLVDENKFGQYYELIGVLHGPSGTGLRVKTIWMRESLSG